MNIRPAMQQDWPNLWPFIKDVIRSGETYAYDADMSEADAKATWLDYPRMTFVAEDETGILGSYYIKTNFGGNASHICNCGYMVSPTARGKGVATAMCEHSQHIARGMEYKAMQFNFVVSTNSGAVQLWQKLGFDIVGTIPNAFNHPASGLVESYVMYKWLAG